MNIAKHTFAVSAVNCLIQLYLIISYFRGDQGFANFWVSTGFAYGLFAFGIIICLCSLHDIRHTKNV